jgi:hypothetical protein
MSSAPLAASLPPHHRSQRNISAIATHRLRATRASSYQRPAAAVFGGSLEDRCDVVALPVAGANTGASGEARGGVGYAVLASSQGLVDTARHVIGCQLTQNARLE